MFHKQTEMKEIVPWRTCTWFAAGGVLLSLAVLAGCGAGGSGAAGNLAASTPVSLTSSPSSTTITITKGGTYSGKWSSNSPSVPAVLVTTDEPVTILNSTVTGRSDLIAIQGKTGANVTITNVTGTAQDPQVAGMARGMFVNAVTTNALVVKNCTVAGASFGVYLSHSTMTGRLQITNNTATNLEDRASDGKGGLQTTRPKAGHFIMVATANLPNGADIGWNQDIQTVGQSSTEDVINIYSSHGTASLPILVHDNYMEGYSSTTTPVYTGTGIIADGDATGGTAYVIFQANDIVHAAGGGIGIASGHDITAKDNRVVSCGVDTFGNAYARPGVAAVTMWNFYNAPNFYNNLITTTTGGVLNKNSAGQLVISDISAITTGPTVAVTGNLFTDPCLLLGLPNPAAEDLERAYWAAKVLTNNILLGDQHLSI